jgi:hypothetical protein
MFFSDASRMDIRVFPKSFWDARVFSLSFLRQNPYFRLEFFSDKNPHLSHISQISLFFSAQKSVSFSDPPLTEIGVFLRFFLDRILCVSQILLRREFVSFSVLLARKSLFFTVLFWTQKFVSFSDPSRAEIRVFLRFFMDGIPQLSQILLGRKSVSLSHISQIYANGSDF